jgi:hypothetical protein
MVPTPLHHHVQDVVVLGDQGRHGGLDTSHQLRQIEGFQEELRLSGLDLGEVQDIVDEGQEVPSRRLIFSRSGTNWSCPSSSASSCSISL